MRLRLPPIALALGDFAGGVFLLRRGALLTGVAVRELGTEKDAEPPAALIVERILTRRSEIARGVGWSMPCADVGF